MAGKVLLAQCASLLDARVAKSTFPVHASKLPGCQLKALGLPWHHGFDQRIASDRCGRGYGCRRCRCGSGGSRSGQLRQVGGCCGSRSDSMKSLAGFLYQGSSPCSHLHLGFSASFGVYVAI